MERSRRGRHEHDHDKRLRAPSSRGRKQQAGASLLFALITLVALALAASALVRSVDTGAVVMGNLGAKKATAAAADRATQMAINYLVINRARPTRLIDDDPGLLRDVEGVYNITGYGDPDRGARKALNWDVDGSAWQQTTATRRPRAERLPS